MGLNVSNKALRELIFCFDYDYVAAIASRGLRLRKTWSSVQGARPTKRPGPGFSFLGYKEYEPGDDLRLLDVHKLITHGRRLVKQFELSSGDPITVILDLSSSMFAGASGPSVEKGALAINLACSFSLVASLSGSPAYLGIIGFRDEAIQRRRIQFSAPILRPEDYIRRLDQEFLRSQLDDLAREGLRGRSANAADFARLQPKVPRQQVMLISDFWFPVNDLATGLGELGRQAQNIYLFQTLAADELDPDWTTETVTVMDAERSHENIVVELNAAMYRAKSALFMDQLRHQAAKVKGNLQVIGSPRASSKSVVADLRGEVQKLLVRTKIFC